MIFDFLRKLIGTKPTDAAPAEAKVEYQGYDILPAPQQDPAGWRVHGVISRPVDGEIRHHTFTRADTCAGREDAVAITLAKARRIIDEQGERLFAK